MSAEELYFDDLRVGMAWSGQPVTLSAEAIIGFGHEYDPQSLHTDPAAAAAGPFGGLIASGWQVAGLMMRQFVEARPFGASFILGLGIDELRWLKPVRPGDVLRAQGEIVELKASRSRPDRGVVRTFIQVFNQTGEVVMSLVGNSLLPVR